ncbi:MAG TPA: phospho-sugar mutase [Symbiobacteriaceae bacterium]|nr:phospho-sugar mutase [Symbiobacteriaceae bacterium]
MTTALDRYRLWAQHPYFDETTRTELAGIAGDAGDIEERFYKYLEFGTGGLRGIIGAGTNRMNRYTVRQAAQGLADYIATFGGAAKARGVVIAHDNRRFSPEFALEAALTLNANGIVAYLWDSLRPTPMLSYAVRKLGTISGIVVTASHNPKEYNGFKVYWEDGGQIPPERAASIQQHIRAADEVTAIAPMDAETARIRGLLRRVPAAVDNAYYDEVVRLAMTVPAARAACRILYTPLHGTGSQPVREVLGLAGFPVSVVAEQAEPDAEFSTIGNPNPEDPGVYTLALEQARRESPDVILATDADADRLGVLARDRHGVYHMLTGNQIGALLVDYLISSRPIPEDAAVVKTIATSNMIVPLCREHGVALFETHTGFKFIGDIIGEFEKAGSPTFLIGYEESYGYLGATFVRDKDAVMAALLVADAVAFYKAQNATLYGALEQLWVRCGHFQEALHNVTLVGQEGERRIRALMESLRQDPPVEIAGIRVAHSDDYWTGVSTDLAAGTTHALDLGRANVLHYRFADGGFVMVRPSGTEPKLKLYFSVVGRSEADANERLNAVRSDMLARMGLD